MGTKLTSDLRSISSSQKVDSASARRRFLARLDDSSDGSSEENTPRSSPHKVVESGTSPKPSQNRLVEEERMGMLQNNGDYESIRNAQILENQARLASLGLHKTLLELRSKTQVREKRKVDRKIDYSCNPRRSSHRLKGISADLFTQPIERRVKRPFLRSSCGSSQWLSQEEFVRLCASQSRASIHHPIYGIGCHNCGERKLCGEDDCKRCGDLDLDQPCIGKTDCSVCHSKKGMICRACLRVRYGEELEEVRENKQWMCPHCIEDKGIKPFWICNRYICLRKRNMAPIGNTAFKARETGHKSVAHLIMDKLQQAATAAHLNNGRCDKNRIKRKGKFAKKVFQF